MEAIKKCSVASDPLATENKSQRKKKQEAVRIFYVKYRKCFILTDPFRVWIELYIDIN